MNISYILNGVIILLVVGAICAGISVSLDVATLKADMIYVKRTVAALAKRPIVMVTPLPKQNFKTIMHTIPDKVEDEDYKASDI